MGKKTQNQPVSGAAGDWSRVWLTLRQFARDGSELRWDAASGQFTVYCCGTEVIDSKEFVAFGTGNPRGQERADNEKRLGVAGGKAAEIASKLGRKLDSPQKSGAYYSWRLT